MRRLALALVHHPVLDRGGGTVTTAITNLDLHDMARSARTYGVGDLFIVHPIEAQRLLAERIRSFVDEELSLGDFVMTGGEVAAMAVIEATVRLLPGVLGNEQSTHEESHAPATGGMLEYPQYTRPVEFRGERVPDVLQSGHHAEIDKWRKAQSVVRTEQRRPDLLKK